MTSSSGRIPDASANASRALPATPSAAVAVVVEVVRIAADQLHRKRDARSSQGDTVEVRRSGRYADAATTKDYYRQQPCGFAASDGTPTRMVTRGGFTAFWPQVGHGRLRSTRSSWRP